MAFCIRDCRALPQLAAEVWLQCGLHCNFHTARQSDTAATVVAPPIDFRCTLRMRVTLDFRTGAKPCGSSTAMHVLQWLVSQLHFAIRTNWPRGPQVHQAFHDEAFRAHAGSALRTYSCTLGLPRFQALLNSSQSSSATIRRLRVYCKALPGVGIDISADLLSKIPGSRIECNASSMRIVLQDPSQSCDQQQKKLRAAVLSCSGATQASCMHRYAHVLNLF